MNVNEFDAFKAEDTDALFMTTAFKVDLFHPGLAENIMWHIYCG